MGSFRGSMWDLISWPGIEPWLHALGAWNLNHWTTGPYLGFWFYTFYCGWVLSCFSHVWLCNPMNCGLPGFSVHGIVQARILEWVAIPSSRGSSQSRTPVSNHICFILPFFCACMLLFHSFFCLYREMDINIFKESIISIFWSIYS